MAKPFCTFFAGPNGSGKSSIYEKLQPPGEFVNADEIAKTLPKELEGSARQVKAGRLAITRINQLIAAQEDFVFETTLSSQHSIGVMERAKAAGFHVSLLFVALDKAERNVERVQFRVADGGHDIPAKTIIRRYEASFSNLVKALQIVDEGVLMDNSRRTPHIVVAIKNGKIVARSYRTAHLNRRLMEIAEKALVR
ncbi:hypothetical protein EFQ99_25195 [Rhizobium vallis]|uniref:Zeta toxin domain-containing protein n=1 Tax=Rhizobium vallis TaxID=634290 RepID=A0A432PEB2_9HYPH|nr:zeta toxin family protein [Rhizobium vallis]RUM22192.1 hypothetical protein EFQ99_25195 [Rhizobium vallis]